MCNSPTCNGHDDPFAGLDEDLRDYIPSPEQAFRNEVELTHTEFARKALRRSTSTVTYEEACRDCRGTGKFYSYTGRYVGPCFKCKGEGVRKYKTSAEQREKGREAAQRSRDAKAELIAQQAREWRETHADEYKTLCAASARGFEFAESMLEAINTYGYLTEKQQAAVTRMHEKSVAREAQWAAEREQQAAAAPSIDISRIAVALATAQANGLKWPKLRLAGFEFSPAGANSKNPGAVYVKTSGDGYLGKIMDGRFQKSRECSPELAEGILAAAADPEAAATAYGLQTGVCSCCGRELTNPESVARGIGPICAEKWGW